MGRRTLLGLLALAALVVLCLYCGAPRIQQDIHDRSVAAVEGAGYDASLVSVDGRDVTLTGTVPSEAERERLVNLLSGLEGVRAVDDQLTVGAFAGIADPLQLLKQRQAITLRGRMTQQAHDDLLAKAHEIWGVDNVIDEIEIDSSAPGWNLDVLGNLLDILKGRRGALNLDFFGDRLEVNGELLSDLRKRRLLGRLQTAFPGLDILGEGLVLRAAASPLEELQLQLDTELADKIIEFETDSDNLTAAGQAVLDSVVAMLTGNEARIAISGHTDSTGDFDHNMDLSRRRAEAVKNYLVGNGLAASRFETSWFGSTRPIANNDTPEGRSRNRRTELDVLEEN